MEAETVAHRELITTAGQQHTLEVGGTVTGPASTRTVRKVIVAVHGIGDQYNFATIQAVVNQFCRYHDQPAAVPLGLFHTGKPPYSINPPYTEGTFDHLAFAEVYWAKVPRKAVDDQHTIEEAKKWAVTLVERLRLDGKLSHLVADFRDEDYARVRLVLQEMIQTLAVLERLSYLASQAGLFSFNLRKLLDNYLGDVQIVTEFHDQRAEILKAFSEVMWTVHERHPEADIFIVAHSEGTVISLLGLLQAGRRDVPPAWLRQVGGLMTLGSPIDKHLVLWPTLFGDEPLSPSYDPPHSIEWRNYYDLGDPVGFDLVGARRWIRTNGWERLFSFTPDHDYGFTRYPFPGKAHIDYWNDEEVFGHFIQTVVKEERLEDSRKKLPAGSQPRPPARDERRPPRSIWWKKAASFIVPYVGILLLIFLGVYLVENAVDGALQPDTVMRPWTSFALVGSTTLLLLGVTMAARVPRLTRDGRARFLGLAVAVILALLGIWLGEGMGEAPDFITRVSSGAYLVSASTLTVIALIVTRVRPRFGLKPLIFAGVAAIAVFVASGVWETPAKELGPIWPIFLAMAAFLYLWWLAALILDLVLVWHVLIHNPRRVRKTLAQMVGRTVLVALALLPAPLTAQRGYPPASETAPFSCADTSVKRWLPADNSPDRSAIEARELLEHALARKYAPILRFAPSERYFPTLPFWPAFLDSARSIVTPSKHFGDPRADGTRPELPAIFPVRQAYDSALKQSAPPYRLKLPVPVVFYRVCDFISPAPKRAAGDSADLDQAKAEESRWRQRSHYLWDYLRSDEQAWRRFFLETESAGHLLPRPTGELTEQTIKIREITRFHVIQYFVYYLQDWGLLGHSEDMEYAFVFVPVDTLSARSLRVIVGAGHDPPAPNNVLAMIGLRDAANERRFHPNILVELGGHSSAPDMPPYGQFSAGLDVNWHIDDIWGTRDEQATAGLAFAGRYEGTMTYPRDPEDAVTLFPKGFGASPDSARQVIADLVRVSPDYLAERAHRAGHREGAPSSERRELAEAFLHSYRSILQSSEAETFEAVRTSDSAHAIQKQYPDQTSSQYQTEVTRAIAEDSTTREAELQKIEARRDTQLTLQVDSLLHHAFCGDSSHRARKACPTLTESLRGATVSAVVELLKTRSERIPDSTLITQVLDTTPDPDLDKTALDAITSEIRQVVTERLQPEYSLVPVHYLQALYRGAVDSNPDLVKRYLRLVTRMLHPVTCDELACGLYRKRGAAFDRAFENVVCGSGAKVPGSVFWPQSLACRFDPSMVASIRMWDNDVYDIHDNTGKSKQWPAWKHEVWKHELYREPEAIFRTFLFRPTATQVKHSRASFWGLFHGGVTFDFGRATNPYVGLIIPARLGLPIKIPGYLAVQAGPYLGQPWRSQKVMPSLSVLYDRQFVYFYGLFLKAQWVNRRSDVEGGSGASDLTWTFGGSIWARFLGRVHVRPGIRFDTHDVRPSLDRTVWELQIEYRR